MAKYIPDDLPLPVAESARISNNTIELIQTGFPSFNISDSYQDPNPDLRQVHRGLELPDISFHTSDDLTFEIIEGGKCDSSDIHLDTPSISRPIPANLMRSCNYQRNRNRPAEPQDISFVLDYNWIPQEFLQRDNKISGARHIVFTTLPQLQLLNNASVIYCDATFKVVRQLVSQLFSFHSFLGDANNENVKQVPLAFIMISRRRKRDYTAVFKHMKEIIPTMNLIRLITDFEAAIWYGARKIQPNIAISGCNCHWGQALWRKV